MAGGRAEKVMVADLLNEVRAHELEEHVLATRSGSGIRGEGLTLGIG